MKDRIVKGACALTAAVLFQIASSSAQEAESPQRAHELADSQSPPSEARPALPERPSELLTKGSAHAGEPVADFEQVMAGAQGEATSSAAFFPTNYSLLGNGLVALPSPASHLCALHKLRGVMETNALVRTRVFENNTQELGALDGNGLFSSSAACVPKSKFFNDSASPISQIFPTKFSFVENGSTWYNEEWGNAAAILSGIGGPFRGVNDRAWVWQEPKNMRNVVDIVSDGAGYIIGYSTAFWFNESAGPQKAIKFIGPGGTGSAATAGEYYILQNGAGDKSVSMANADYAFCYFTGINGALSQPNDMVRISVHPSTHNYVLQVTNTNGASLHAYARCMAFDQR